MDKFQKETEKILLDHEKEVFNQLRGTYLNALVDIKKNVAKLKDQIDELTATDPDNKSLIQSKIYQFNYQKAMEEQLNGVLDVVRDKNVSNVTTFLEKMYEDSFLSINYHLQQKKIPVIMPINHKLLVDVLNTPTADLKFSERLYSQMEDFKKTVKAEISRGIAVGSSYQDMARQISEVARVDMNRAYRIARTEGGRVSSTAKMDSMREAKKKGADVVKVWDSVLDGNTRPLHMQLDGQWAEVDKPFKVGGVKVMHPHGFGRASEDVNCRCVLLSVPRWDLDDTVIKYDNTSEQLIKTHNYESWKKGYYEVLPQNERITKVVSEADKRIARYKKGETVKEVIHSVQKENTNIKDIINPYYREFKKVLQKYEDVSWDQLTHKIIKEKDEARKKFFDKFFQEVDKIEFYSEDIEHLVKDRLQGDLNYKIALIDLDKIAREEKLDISSSPYSLSTYALEEGEEITWGYKPIGSYRVSDHWNFESRGEIHCKLSNTNKYTKKVYLAKYNGKDYDIISTYFDSEE